MTLVLNPETIHLVAGWVLQEDQVLRILRRNNIPYNESEPLGAFDRLLEKPGWVEWEVRVVYCFLELFCHLKPGEPPLCMLVVHEVPEHPLPVTAPQAPIGIPAEGLAFDILDGKTRQRAISVRRKILDDLGEKTSEPESAGTALLSEAGAQTASWVDIPWRVTQDTDEMSLWDSSYGSSGVRILYEVDPVVANAALKKRVAEMLREAREGTPSISGEDED